MRPPSEAALYVQRKVVRRPRGREHGEFNLIGRSVDTGEAQ
jgi:hypothetical protein